MITPNDLKKALQKENDSIGNLKLNEMIDYMINEVDIDEDGKINFHEFVTIMMALWQSVMFSISTLYLIRSFKEIFLKFMLMRGKIVLPTILVQMINKMFAHLTNCYIKLHKLWEDNQTIRKNLD